MGKQEIKHLIRFLQYFLAFSAPKSQGDSRNFVGTSCQGQGTRKIYYRIGTPEGTGTILSGRNSTVLQGHLRPPLFPGRRSEAAIMRAQRTARFLAQAVSRESHNWRSCWCRETMGSHEPEVLLAQDEARHRNVLCHL